MTYYDLIAEKEVDGFKIIVDKTYEDMNPSNLFDEDELDEIYTKINDGTYEWFTLRVRAMLNGHEFGSAYLGGCLYYWNKVEDVMTDGTADGGINEAVYEAKQEVVRMKALLEVM